eukprot:363818-Chlamydomonas_euryale.AAC.9
MWTGRAQTRCGAASGTTAAQDPRCRARTRRACVRVLRACGHGVCRAVGRPAGVERLCRVRFAYNIFAAPDERAHCG